MLARRVISTLLDLYRYFLPHIILPEDDKVIFDIVQSADTDFSHIRISRDLAMQILRVLLRKRSQRWENSWQI